MWARFKYWFVNVYWYHYRIHALVLLAAGGLLALFISDMITRVDPDFAFIVASERFISDEKGDYLAAVFAEGSTDCDGDGKILLQPIVMTLDDTEAGMAMMQKLAASYARLECSLYIVGTSLFAYVEEPSAFIDLAALGIRTLPGKPWLADLGGSSLMAGAGLDGEPMTAAVRVTPLQKNGEPDPAWESNRAWALLCLRRLTEGA